MVIVRMMNFYYGGGESGDGVSFFVQVKAGATIGPRRLDENGNGAGKRAPQRAFVGRRGQTNNVCAPIAGTEIVR